MYMIYMCTHTHKVIHTHTHTHEHKRWKQRPLSRTDPLPVPLTPDDYWYSPEGLSKLLKMRSNSKSPPRSATDNTSPPRSRGAMSPYSVISRASRANSTSPPRDHQGSARPRGRSARSVSPGSAYRHDVSKNAEVGWEDVRDQRVRVMGMRHLDGTSLSRSLDANCARDRRELIDLVERTNESLRERGYRALQSAEAARRKMLQVCCWCMYVCVCVYVCE